MSSASVAAAPTGLHLIINKNDVLMVVELEVFTLRRSLDQVLTIKAVSGLVLAGPEPD